MTLLTPAPSPTADLPSGGTLAPVAGETPTTTYEKTRSGMPKLRPYIADTWSRRPFIWHLARTSLKAENYDTAAGQIWIVLNPLFMALVYLMVRSIFMGGSNSAERANNIDNLIMGVFFFKFASAALGNGANSILANSQMVLNTAFPRIIFPLSAAIQAFMEFLPTLLVFFAIHWYLDQPFSHAMVYLPVVVLLLVVFNMGLSLFFAPLNVLYKDVKSFVPYISKVWLFATPVMYTVGEIEENAPQLLRWLQLNPLFPFFAVLEDIFDGVTPPLYYLGWAALWSFGFFVVGTILFLRKERYFARRL
jgi:ABC-type polysaccharide/polyol phosphate export permease